MLSTKSLKESRSVSFTSLSEKHLLNFSDEEERFFPLESGCHLVGEMICKSTNSA